MHFLIAYVYRDGRAIDSAVVGPDQLDPVAAAEAPLLSELHEQYPDAVIHTYITQLMSHTRSGPWKPEPTLIATAGHA